MHAAIKVTHDLSAVSLGLSCKRFYSPDRPREGPGMALRSPGRGQGKGSGSPRKSPGRTQDGSGRAPRRLMVQGGNEGEGKSRGGEEGREGGGFEFPLPLARRGGEEAFSNSPLLLPRTWEEGVLNSFPLLARRGREEVLIPSPFWPEGRGRGDACLFWSDGGRGCI